MIFTNLGASFRREISLRSPSFLREQCRNFNLVYAATTKIAHGNHKVKAFTRAPAYKSSKDVQLVLWTEKPRKEVGKMTLKEVLNKHIKPGKFLIPLMDRKKSLDGTNEYMIADINTETVPTIKPGVKTKAKIFHFKVPVPLGYFRNRMHHAYHMVKQRYTLEFHVHLQGPKSKEEIGEKMQHELHLRPDVILMGLPETAGIVIDPQTDNQEVCWAVRPPEIVKPKGEVLSIPRLPQDITSSLLRRRQAQFDRDVAGVGMPLHAERKKLKQDVKSALEKSEAGLDGLPTLPYPITETEARYLRTVSKTARMERKMKKQQEKLEKNERVKEGRKQREQLQQLQGASDIAGRLPDKEPPVFRSLFGSMRPDDARVTKLLASADAVPKLKRRAVYVGEETP